VVITWKSGTGGGATSLTGAMSFVENGGMSDCWNPEGKLSGPFFFETVSGQALNMSLGGAVQVSGAISYLLL
jgi:hypothetical protein